MLKLVFFSNICAKITVIYIDLNFYVKKYNFNNKYSDNNFKHNLVILLVKVSLIYFFRNVHSLTKNTLTEN